MFHPNIIDTNVTMANLYIKLLYIQSFIGDVVSLTHRHACVACGFFLGSIWIEGEKRGIE